VTNGLPVAESDEHTKTEGPEMTEQTQTPVADRDIDIPDVDDNYNQTTNNPITAPSSDRAGDESMEASEIIADDLAGDKLKQDNTTIYEERWTGRDVLRGMSEELSELDEDELEDLGGDESKDEIKEESDKVNGSVPEPVNVRRTRRRYRGFR
jgi:NuA3 HAT complex component NTO1